MAASYGVQIYDGALMRSLEIETATRVMLEHLGDIMVEEAQVLVPVDTGYLQDHIQYYLEQRDIVTGQFTPWTMWFGDDADYAAYVELGTRFQKAQPFLRPVAYKHRDDLL